MVGIGWDALGVEGETDAYGSCKKQQVGELEAVQPVVIPGNLQPLTRRGLPSYQPKHRR